MTAAFSRIQDISAAFAYSQNARIAGRLNAATVSEEEQSALLDERQQLLDKQFAGAITKKETYRLEYVRWSLDRIEDAKYGQTLDLLEGAVARYEVILEEIRVLQNTLSEFAKGKRHS